MKFVVTRVPVSAEKPHGIDYSFTLHGLVGERLVGFDNAHLVRGQGRGDPQDHRHRLRTVRPYGYSDATTLLADFWNMGDAALRQLRCIAMTTLKVGIASFEEMKARTLAVARGERGVDADEPKVWFTSTESFARILSASNRALLRLIAVRMPQSPEDLAEMAGRAKSNLSRTLKTMEQYGLVRLERDGRGRITPKVIYDRVELDVPLILQRKVG